MLKKNCLYIIREKEYSKKRVGLGYRINHKLLFGPPDIFTNISGPIGRTHLITSTDLQDMIILFQAWSLS